MSLFLCNSRSNARGEFEGCSKSPRRFWDWDDEVAGRIERERFLPDRKSVMGLPLFKSTFFSQKGSFYQRKHDNELVIVSGQTWAQPTAKPNAMQMQWWLHNSGWRFQVSCGSMQSDINACLLLEDQECSLILFWPQFAGVVFSLSMRYVRI